MSGLLALLDDVAAIAKVAAASVDDVAGMAAKAGSKTAGVLIDDAAVTPKYLHGFDAARELPIIWKITKGSLFNKMVILLPAALLMNAFAPWLVMPLLMIGGCYLCFEGAEKIYHVLAHGADHSEAESESGNKSHLEEQRVRGAIKTDFILSAEIMTIALSTIPEIGFWLEAATLAVVGLGITFLVYGAVAIIVKMDDVGMWFAARGQTSLGRALGRGLVKFMPWLLKALSVIGTAAMLWVGGSIVLHGLEVTHLWAWPYETIHHLAENIALSVSGGLQGLVEWAVTAFADGVFGLVLGLLLIPVATRVIGPLFARFTGKETKAH